MEELCNCKGMCVCLRIYLYPLLFFWPSLLTEQSASEDDKLAHSRFVCVCVCVCARLPPPPVSHRGWTAFRKEREAFLVYMYSMNEYGHAYLVVFSEPCRHFIFALFTDSACFVGERVASSGRHSLKL